MKYFYYILIIIFIGLIGYNLYEMDFTHLSSPVNYIGWVCVLSGICGLILSIIMLKVSSIKDINAKTDEEK